MSYKNYLKMDDATYDHVYKNMEDFRNFNNHDISSPKITIGLPNKNHFTTPELISSPEIMMKNAMDTIQGHLDIGDDYIPQARIEFGTGQVAHAFGCGMYIPEHSPVCNRDHVLHNPEDVENLELPSLYAGWMDKVYDFTSYYMENKPDIVQMQIPDYQGPFNNAELVRGPDVLYDFYDCPEYVHMLLQKMTDYQVELTKHYRKIAKMEDGYFADWGVYWKGGARISNCSLDLISPTFYLDFVKQYDEQFIEAVGGGRLHYCGGNDSGLIKAMGEVKGNVGIDIDVNLHDMWEVCKMVPDDVILLMSLNKERTERILSGDVPAKRNVIYTTGASNAEEGKALYKQLKEALAM